ncbi:MAG: type II toxin-antitoxin system MqsR family toxin [Treponema sp.]|nr:type II toxin-antitoxin system MqsR family toxin [Treponema sp.]
MPGQYILQYLTKVKELVSSGYWTLIPRKKNLDSLSNHGLLIQDVKTELLSLGIGDYESGPELDYSYSGEIWIFKRTINNIDFYIKLKIDVANDGTEILKCLSFHEQEV